MDRADFAGAAVGYIVAYWDDAAGRWTYRPVVGGALLTDEQIVALGLDAPLSTVPEPPSPALVVYGQRDPRWANLVYAGGATFGQYGCFVCCVAMMASLTTTEPLEPPAVAALLREFGAFSGSLLANPARISTAFLALTWEGVVHYRSKPADMDAVRAHVTDHGAVIAEVAFNPSVPVVYTVDGVTRWNQHFVVVTQIAGDDVEIADPWEGNRVMLTESRYYKRGWPKRADRVITGLRLVGRA